MKVLDFGLAKALDPVADVATSAAMNSPTLTARATQMGVILGTAAYMAPEQARGKAVDRRADIWAFGVVLYEMLTGRRAFEGDDISVTLANVIKDHAVVGERSRPTCLPPCVACFAAASKRTRSVVSARLVMPGSSSTRSTVRPMRLPPV